MPFFPFDIRRTYTTSFSQEEVLAIVSELLSSKSKFLFFSVRKFFGRVKGGKFQVSMNHSTSRLLVPVVKGQMLEGKPTVVELILKLPIIPTVAMTSAFLVLGIGLLTSDQMTINGVLREPTSEERVIFIGLIIAIPTVVFYFTILRPLQELRSELKKRLRLQEKY
jgi:hypothetical protein